MDGGWRDGRVDGWMHGWMNEMMDGVNEKRNVNINMCKSRSSYITSQAPVRLSLTHVRQREAGWQRRSYL